jgi:hypothetical protein
MDTLGRGKVKFSLYIWHEELGLVFGEKMKGLEGFMDADGATQEHRHTISGYAFLIDGGTVSWSSKKQELITLYSDSQTAIALTCDGSYHA